MVGHFRDEYFQSITCTGIHKTQMYKHSLSVKLTFVKKQTTLKET